MDAIDLVPLLEALDEDIDGLEEALVPLTKGTLVDAASRLPLLDKAQLFVLVTYAIETILFCRSCIKPIFAPVLIGISISTTQWHQRQGTRRIPRTHEG